MLGGFFWGCGNLTRSDFEEDLCVPMKLKKDIGTMITAKMKFLLGYKMIIVGGVGYETLVRNKNLVEGRRSLLGVTFLAMLEGGG